MKIFEIKTSNVDAICCEFEQDNKKHRIAFAYKNKVRSGFCPIVYDLILLKESDLEGDDYMDTIDRDIKFEKNHKGVKDTEGVWDYLSKLTL